LVNIFKQGRQLFADAFDVPDGTARSFMTLGETRRSFSNGYSRVQKASKRVRFLKMLSRNLGRLPKIIVLPMRAMYGSKWVNWCFGQGIEQYNRSTFVTLNTRSSSHLTWR
jgi:hypothetical protein